MMDRDTLLLYLHASAAFQYLYSGFELEVFHLLRKSKLKQAEIGAELNLPAPSVRALMFGLAALGLVNVEDEIYSNGSEIESLFESGEWDLFHAMLQFQDCILYPGQARLTESLKQGSNLGLRVLSDSSVTIYELFGSDGELRKVFYDYMEAYSAFAVPHLLSNIKIPSSGSSLDVGGGLGTNAISIAKHYPELTISILDLPHLRELVQKNIAASDAANRVVFEACNIFEDQFPSPTNCIFFIHQLVIWGPDQNRMLLKKAYDCLESNGQVVIFSSIAEDSETGPLMAALDTAYFLSIATGNGMIYPWKDYEKWLTEAGFKEVTRTRCNTWTPHGIIVAKK